MSNKTKISFNILIFLYWIFIKPTNQLHNDNQTDGMYQSKPTFVKDPYLLLMFNGTSDLKDYAIFSEYKENNKRQRKYTGAWNIEVTKSTPFVNDYSLVMKGESAYSAVSFGMKKPFNFKSPCLIVQYDTRFPNDHDCGGAYIKLLSETVNMNLKVFSNSTPYTIMFGPDKCGMDYEVKFLFQYKDPLTKEYKERKFKETEKTYPRFIGDNVTHVNTLMVCENNSVQIFKDLRLIKEGNLLTDFEPPLSEDEFIVDIDDSKPKDWEEKEEIPDPTVKKPIDWDEDQEEFIIDTDAKKPKTWLDNEPAMVQSKDQKPYNWDEVKDGKWDPPMVKNFKCKVNGCGKWSPPKIRNSLFRGKWQAPIIKNPNFQGKWKPRMILNPNFRPESDAYKNLRPFGSLGIEILSQKPGIFFDNFLITDNFTAAREFAMETWWPKYKVDTVDMPHYQDIFNKTKKVHKLNLSEYIHWFWASVPLAVGIPFLSYIAILVLKKSNRDPNLIREKCLLRVYEQLKKNDERYYTIVNNSDDTNLPEKEVLTEVPDAIIEQVCHEPNEKFAAIIRKRISRKANIEVMQLPAGDVL